MQQPTPLLRHLLMAHPTARHRQRREHVHVMARQVQADQQLEDECPAGESGGEEDEQAGGGAAVCHHVEHGAELG